jgi:hypothetical protein
VQNAPRLSRSRATSSSGKESGINAFSDSVTDPRTFEPNTEPDHLGVCKMVQIQSRVQKNLTLEDLFDAIEQVATNGSLPHSRWEHVELARQRWGVGKDWCRQQPFTATCSSPARASVFNMQCGIMFEVYAVAIYMKWALHIAHGDLVANHLNNILFSGTVVDGKLTATSTIVDLDGLSEHTLHHTPGSMYMPAHSSSFPTRGPAPKMLFNTLIWPHWLHTNLCKVILTGGASPSRRRRTPTPQAKIVLCIRYFSVSGPYIRFALLVVVGRYCIIVLCCCSCYNPKDILKIGSTGEKKGGNIKKRVPGQLIFQTFH